MLAEQARLERFLASVRSAELERAACRADAKIAGGIVQTVGINAVKNLFELKSRSFDKPLYLLAYSVEEIYEYACNISDYALDLMKKYFPGSLAIILCSQKKLYTKPNEKGETIGVRIPKYPALLEFLQYVKMPILNTSANISGEPPLQTKEDVVKVFGNRVYYVEFREDIKMLGIPSTIVDATKEKPVIIRQGAIEL